MKEEIKKFLEFNGKLIHFLSVDGQYWIALNPICDALGILWKKQHEKLQNGEDIFGELSTDQGMVAADGKVRKMTSLPEKYVYGWIFSIPISGSMSDETKKNLKAYKMECCELLYAHFHGATIQRKELVKQKAANYYEIEALKNKVFSTDEAILLAEAERKQKAIDKSLKNTDYQQFTEEMDLFKQNIENSPI